MEVRVSAGWLYLYIDKECMYLDKRNVLSIVEAHERDEPLFLVIIKDTKMARQALPNLFPFKLEHLETVSILTKKELFQTKLAGIQCTVFKLHKISTNLFKGEPHVRSDINK